MQQEYGYRRSLPTNVIIQPIEGGSPSQPDVVVEISKKGRSEGSSSQSLTFAIRFLPPEENETNPNIVITTTPPQERSLEKTESVRDNIFSPRKSPVQEGRSSKSHPILPPIFEEEEGISTHRSYLIPPLEIPKQRRQKRSNSAPSSADRAFHPPKSRNKKEKKKSENYFKKKIDDWRVSRKDKKKKGTFVPPTLSKAESAPSLYFEKEKKSKQSEKISKDSGQRLGSLFEPRLEKHPKEISKESLQRLEELEKKYQSYLKLPEVTDRKFLRYETIYQSLAKKFKTIEPYIFDFEDHVKSLVLSIVKPISSKLPKDSALEEHWKRLNPHVTRKVLSDLSNEDFIIKDLRPKIQTMAVCLIEYLEKKKKSSRSSHIIVKKLYQLAKEPLEQPEQEEKEKEKLKEKEKEKLSIPFSFQDQKICHPGEESFDESSYVTDLDVSTSSGEIKPFPLRIFDFEKDIEKLSTRKLALLAKRADAEEKRLSREPSEYIHESPVVFFQESNEAVIFGENEEAKDPPALEDEDYLDLSQAMPLPLTPRKYRKIFDEADIKGKEKVKDKTLKEMLQDLLRCNTGKSTLEFRSLLEELLAIPYGKMFFLLLLSPKETEALQILNKILFWLSPASNVEIGRMVEKAFKKIKCQQFVWEEEGIEDLLNRMDLMQVDRCIYSPAKDCMLFKEIEINGNKFEYYSSNSKNGKFEFYYLLYDMLYKAGFQKEASREFIESQVHLYMDFQPSTGDIILKTIANDFWAIFEKTLRDLFPIYYNKPFLTKPDSPEEAVSISIIVKSNLEFTVLVKKRLNVYRSLEGKVKSSENPLMPLCISAKINYFSDLQALKIPLSLSIKRGKFSEEAAFEEKKLLSRQFKFANPISKINFPVGEHDEEILEILLQPKGFES